MLRDAHFLGILFAFGLLTRFALLNYPRAVVFDEFHFVRAPAPPPSSPVFFP